MLYSKLMGQLVLSLAQVGGVVALIGFQWSTSHVFNTNWHPHARFHAVQLSLFFVGLSILGLWLIWGRSLESHITALVATAVPVLFWSGEFVALLVPGTNPSPDLVNLNTFRLLGFDIHGNLFFSGVMIVLSAVGYWLMTRGTDANAK